MKLAIDISALKDILEHEDKIPSVVNKINALRDNHFLEIVLTDINNHEASDLKELEEINKKMGTSFTYDNFLKVDVDIYTQQCSLITQIKPETNYTFLAKAQGRRLPIYQTGTWVETTTEVTYLEGKASSKIIGEKILERRETLMDLEYKLDEFTNEFEVKQRIAEAKQRIARKAKAKTPEELAAKKTLDDKYLTCPKWDDNKNLLALYISSIINDKEDKHILKDFHIDPFDIHAALEYAYLWSDYRYLNTCQNLKKDYSSFDFHNKFIKALTLTISAIESNETAKSKQRAVLITVICSITGIGAILAPLIYWYCFKKFQSEQMFNRLNLTLQQFEAYKNTRKDEKRNAPLGIEERITQKGSKVCNEDVFKKLRSGQSQLRKIVTSDNEGKHTFFINPHKRKDIEDRIKSRPAKRAPKL